MDRTEMQSCLEQVAAYQASGQKAQEWAQAHGVPLRKLASWCAHAQRWRERLEGKTPPRRGVRPAAAPLASSGGFVAASLPPLGTAATVRVLLPGAAGVELHWPVSHTAELAAWLRETAR